LPGKRQDREILLEFTSKPLAVAHVVDAFEKLAGELGRDCGHRIFWRAAAARMKNSSAASAGVGLVEGTSVTKFPLTLRLRDVR